MNQNTFGATAAAISKITDPAQLQGMLRNPSYAGYTGVIIARIQEINRMHQAQQAMQPPAPTVAQQALQGQPPPSQQAMAKGGIVAFRHGGHVKKFAKGGALGQYTSTYFGQDDTQTGHPEMEHKAKPERMANPFNMVDPYQAKLDAAVAAQQALANRQPVAPAVVTPAGSTAPVNVVTPTPTAQPQDLGPAINPRDYGVDANGNLMLGGSSRISAGVPGGIKSIAEYKRELQTGNEDTANLASDRQAILDAQRQNLHMAMIAAGLNMARDASVNPRAGFLGNLAAGGVSGLGYYTQQGDQQAAQLRDLNKIARQENQALNIAAVRERGEDVRAAQNASAQTAMAKAYANKGFLDEQDIRGYAQYLAGQDRAAGKPVQAPAYYIMQAKEHANGISSGMQIAGANAAARGAIATDNGWLNYQKQFGAIPKERYQQMVSSGQPNALQAESGGTILATVPGTQ